MKSQNLSVFVIKISPVEEAASLALPQKIATSFDPELKLCRGQVLIFRQTGFLLTTRNEAVGLLVCRISFDEFSLVYRKYATGSVLIQVSLSQ